MNLSLDWLTRIRSSNILLLFLHWWAIWFWTSYSNESFIRLNFISLPSLPSGKTIWSSLVNFRSLPVDSILLKLVMQLYSTADFYIILETNRYPDETAPVIWPLPYLHMLTLQTLLWQSATPPNSAAHGSFTCTCHICFVVVSFGKCVTVLSILVNMQT